MISTEQFDKYIHETLEYIKQLKDVEDRLRIITTHLHMIGEDMMKSRMGAYKCVDIKKEV